MMAQRRDIETAALPRPRGRLITDAPLAPLCWFRTGGRADWLFEPKDEADLVAFLAGLPKDMPVTMLGLGSNMLIRDLGVPGIVIRLGKAFGQIEVADGQIRAGGGASMVAVSHAARQAGISGLEFLRGIPGTVGGGVAMNAGAYGREMADCLLSARIATAGAVCLERDAGSFAFSYRHSNIGAGEVVLMATLEGEPGDPAKIARHMDEIAAAREASQPLRTRTGGSTFKNPPGRKAWELIEAAGCRGLRIGAAQVSERHTNFLINLGGATSQDIEDLGEEIRRRVLETSGILLEWEIVRIGRRKERS